MQASVHLRPGSIQIIEKEKIGKPPRQVVEIRNSTCIGDYFLMELFNGIHQPQELYKQIYQCGRDIALCACSHQRLQGIDQSARLTRQPIERASESSGRQRVPELFKKHDGLIGRLHRAKWRQRKSQLSQSGLKRVWHGLQSLL